MDGDIDASKCTLRRLRSGVTNEKDVILPHSGLLHLKAIRSRVDAIVLIFDMHSAQSTLPNLSNM